MIVLSGGWGSSTVFDAEWNNCVWMVHWETQSIFRCKSLSLVCRLDNKKHRTYLLEQWARNWVYVGGRQADRETKLSAMCDKMRSDHPLRSSSVSMICSYCHCRTQVFVECANSRPIITIKNNSNKLSSITLHRVRNSIQLPQKTTLGVEYTYARIT